MMKLHFWLGLTGLAMAGQSVAQLEIVGGKNIPLPTHYNGFEALGPVVSSAGIKSHTEDGITVEYIGGIELNGSANGADPGAGIVTQLSWLAATEGSRLWYPGEWGYGFTRVTFADATAIQFDIATSSSGSQRVRYEAWLDGAMVGSGMSEVNSVPALHWAGFTIQGATFDEVRLWVPGSGVPDTAGLDGLAVLSAAVPEPGRGAFLLAGLLALAGTGLRRAGH